jgi:hypothetical protein
MPEANLPFREVTHYPDGVTPQAIIVRLLDGLGFRFHWATEALREEDYAYSPGAGCKTIGQLVDHIWGLMNWIIIHGHLPQEPRPEAYPARRVHVLTLVQRLREHFADLGAEDLASVQIENKPFWHLINGPLADALTHIGQINSFRRLAGNPPSEANVFGMLAQPFQTKGENDEGS